MELEESPRDTSDRLRHSINVLGVSKRPSRPRSLDEVRGLLSDAIQRRHQMCADLGGHDRGVDNTQVGGIVDFQLSVNHTYQGRRGKVELDVEERWRTKEELCVSSLFPKTCDVGVLFAWSPHLLWMKKSIAVVPHLLKMSFSLALPPAYLSDCFAVDDVGRPAKDHPKERSLAIYSS